MSNAHFLADVDQSWTLFLDRDGVINKKIDNDYVKHIGEFEFLPGVLEAIYLLQNCFYKILVVTNQQGISKGLMSETSLERVHQYLFYEVEQSHGHIDAIYHCPHLAADCVYCRKPNNGMAYMAKADYPFIDFSKSIVVGDSESDINFGKKSGMFTVKVCRQPMDYHSSTADLNVASLIEFSKLLHSYKIKGKIKRKEL